VPKKLRENLQPETRNFRLNLPRLKKTKVHWVNGASLTADQTFMKALGEKKKKKGMDHETGLGEARKVNLKGGKIEKTCRKNGGKGVYTPHEK